MATIKVFTSSGVKELQCYDNYDDAPFETGFEDDSVDLPEFHPDEEEI